MTAVPTAPANGIDLAYETFGDASDPTLLLIMGLNAQRVMWDEGFCALLVARGFHVVRFDNRDVGGSTWIDTPGLDVGAAVMEVLGGDNARVPYLLSDMAADTAGLLKSLGVESAHIVGASMGGMIAQALAIEHPSVVRSLTSIMSTTGEPGVGEQSPDLLPLLLRDAPSTKEEIIEAGIDTFRAIGCAEHFDEVRARQIAEQAYENGWNPQAIGHQLLAILASGSRAEGLARLDLPALVIHGRQDKLVGFSGGQRTAELIAGADFLAIEDMAHDLPKAHWVRIADAISAVANRAA
jgi:pimeloyl-ACP methyl ester carboxylesterase